MIQIRQAWVKDVLTEVYSIFFIEIPEKAAVDTLTGDDEMKFPAWKGAKPAKKY